MAVVDCKGCNAKVSTKQSCCHSCGAEITHDAVSNGMKSPDTNYRQVLLAAFVFLSFLLYNHYKQSTDDKPIAAAPTPQEKSLMIPEGPESVWLVSSLIEPITGEAFTYAASPLSFPSEKMPFPYHDLSSSLLVACKGAGDVAHFGFNRALDIKTINLRGDQFFRARISWDGRAQQVVLNQKWGGNFFGFERDHAAVLNNIMRSKKVRLEFDWHGKGAVSFEYSLNGSSKAIADIRAKCSQY